MFYTRPRPPANFPGLPTLNSLEICLFVVIIIHYSNCYGQKGTADWQIGLKEREISRKIARCQNHVNKTLLAKENYLLLNIHAVQHAHYIK